MSKEKIIVNVDEDLEELIPGFLENRNKDVQFLREALSTGDTAKLQSIGHSLKGVGGGYGFDGLSEIGASIESAAKDKDLGQIEGLVNDMADYLQRIDVVFE
ncbi:MAG: HPt (histidine-containing phosphotransfer) domain-containing protein [Planctomycetota bacterium]|jgi:HPt (histidine-containing phosphotransfer) domain-containing protein